MIIDNKSMRCKNLRDTIKHFIEGNFIALNVYIREDRLKKNQMNFTKLESIKFPVL